MGRERETAEREREQVTQGEKPTLEGELIGAGKEDNTGREFAKA